MFVDMVSIVFPNPPLSLPLVINLLPSPKLFPPLFLFSNLPNPSLYNDEELFRSCYRLFEVAALQFDVKNMFTMIGLVFLQKLYRESRRERSMGGPSLLSDQSPLILMKRLLHQLLI